MTTIARLQAENYKRLKAVEIVPGEGAHLVPILGKNAQGKSSVLDAIMAALGGKGYMPSRPVRKGEEEGAIRLELSNGIVVRRIFAEDGTGSIVVENEEGARYPSPQAVLDKLYSSVAFDPIAFTRLKPAEQLDTLRRLVKLDVDVDELARLNKADYDERREVNREAKQWEGQLSAFGDVGELGEPIDTELLREAINRASTTNGEIEQRRIRREQKEEDRARVRLRIQELEQQLASAKDLLRNLDDMLNNAEPLPEPVDVSALTAQLDEANAHNRRIERAKEKAALQARVESLKKKSDWLTDNMEKREQLRLEAFQKADMPVPGLAFGEGEVLFNDLPFDQASTAEQLRVSTAIGMAGNPELRVMLVRDASLLDEDGFALLAQMAAEGDFQFWMEAVDTGDKVGIIMEDGAVKGAPEPEPIDKGKRRTKKETAEAGQEAHAAATERPVLDDGKREHKGLLDPDWTPDSQDADTTRPDTPAASGTAREAPSGSSSGEPSSISDGAAPEDRREEPAKQPARPTAPASLFD